MRSPRRYSWLLPALLFAPALARASDGHGDAVAPLLVGLAIILLGSKLGGEIAVRLRQPAVLGELAVGVLLGNLHHLGVPLPGLAQDPVVDMLSRLGVIILLFQVGLESTVPQMLSVGGRATLVAVTGVVVPIAGGFVAGRLGMPGEPWVKHLFLGATLCATSVGITARVLQELGVSQSKESRVILGAAVIDDVLGLVVLTLVTGVAVAASSGEALTWTDPARVVVLSAVFLGGAILLGPRVSKAVFRLTNGLRSPGVLLPIALSFAFLLSWLANAVQLAPIVGAFAAGLVLEEAHYRTLLDRGEHQLEELVHPIGQLFVPIFFVIMGMRVDLADFTSFSVWKLATLLIVIAIVSKLACGLVSPGYDRLVIGLGMIPRGEVGLIFADAGRRVIFKGEPLLASADYSAIVLMVLATTVVTPPLLGWGIRRSKAAAAA